MKPLTGPKVLLIAAAAFGTILAANLALAVNAVRTFPGLEVQNSYISSQHFDADRHAQTTLGWKLEASLDDGELRLAFTDVEGQPVQVEHLSASLGRATHVRDDIAPEFAYGGGVYAAQVGPLDPGNWNVRLVATAEDGTEFRQRIVLRLGEG